MLRLSLLSHLTPVRGPRTAKGTLNFQTLQPHITDDGLGTRHSAHCPLYIKHIRGTVKLVNILSENKKNTRRKRKLHTTKYLEATKDFGMNPQLIHKDNSGLSLDFFIIYLPSSL